MKWNPQYRWLLPQDASSPSLPGVFWVGKRSEPRLLLLSFFLSQVCLSLSLLYTRGDDSLLGSNFYGDASSNISGLRLLALVFDERTSWSILSASETCPCVLLSLAIPFLDFATWPLPLRAFPPTYLPNGSTFDASHSRTIRIRFPIRLG